MNHRLAAWGFGLTFSSILSLDSGCTYELPTANSGGAAGASNGGSGGQAGNASLCPADSKPSCDPYTGPTGTLNKGICRAAEPTCLADLSWGECGQETIPTAEYCNSSADVNCDGIPQCTGTPIAPYATAIMQSQQDDVFLSIATSTPAGLENGNVFAVGMRTAVWGAVPMGPRVLAWRRRADGTPENWSSKFNFTTPGGPNGAAATGVVVLPNSRDVVIAGVFNNGTLTLPGAPMATATTSTNSFIARFDTNELLKIASFHGGADTLMIKAIAADSMDNLYVVGQYKGTPTFADKQLPTADDSDGFVASLSADGAYRWAHQLKGTGEQSVEAVAVIDNSTIVIASKIVNDTVLAPPNGSTTFNAGQEPDIIVSNLTTDGNTLNWTTSVHGSGTNAQIDVRALAATPDKVVFGGHYHGTVELPDGPYTNDAPSTEPDYFVAVLDPGNGGIKNSFTQNVAGKQELHAVSIDPVGDIILAGAYEQSLPFPGLVSVGQSKGIDAFVMKVHADLSGAYWARRFGDATSQVALAIGHGQATGSLYVGGGFQGQILEVKPALTSTTISSLDAFLIELSN